MTSKYLALTAIATQIVLGLILVAILATLQSQHTAPTTPAFGGNQPIRVIVEPQPTYCTKPFGFGCGTTAP